MSKVRESLNEAKMRMGGLAKAAPDMFAGFTKIARAATQSGKFSSAQKELMATAIAVVQGCDDCILYHVEGAKRQGADEAALVEALEVAVEMGGGPAIMYAGRALAIFREV